MRRPAFALVVSTDVVLSFWPDISTENQYLTNTATDFEFLPEYVTSHHIMEVIRHIHRITLGYDLYLNKSDNGPSLPLIVWARNSIQHDLLSLEEAPSTDPVTCFHPINRSTSFCHKCSLQHNLIQNLYKVLRLAIMAFTLLVLFPLPRSAGVHSKLSRHLLHALNNCEANKLAAPYDEFLLWGTVLGGVLAEFDTRPLFIERLIQSRASSVLPRDEGSVSTEGVWREQVEAICSRYLWYSVFDLAAGMDLLWSSVLDATRDDT